MPTRDIIVVGASAGGVQALEALVSGLPADLPAAVFVVVHLSPDSPSWLPQILAKAGPLPAEVPADRADIQPGRIYVAPPDRHLLVEPDRVRVVRGPRENRHRPAVDPLFRSAAWSFGPRVIGVVLSGYQDDGVAGVWAVKTCGGLAVVQQSSDALHPDMPDNAAREVEVDYTLPVAEIGPLLGRLSRESVDGAGEFPRPASMKTEIEFAKMDKERDMDDMSAIGELSAFTCPSCGGALWELEDGDILRYRCHTGHAFSRDSLLSEQSTVIEETLYSALRAVEEKAAALRRLGDRHLERAPKLSREYAERVRELDRTADQLRQLLSGRSAA